MWVLASAGDEEHTEEQQLGSLLCPGSPRQKDLGDGIWNRTPGSGFKMS